MFHKIALLINGAFIGFSAVTFCSPFVIQMIPVEISSNWEWCQSQFLFMSQFVIFFCFISIVFVIIASHVTTVKIGRPSLENMTIAYQYGRSDSISTSDVRSSQKLFPSTDKVQICYESKSGPFGLAYGIVIPEELSDEKKTLLIGHGYRFLRTKPVSNAVYISSPAVPWLSYFGQWLILVVIYPKLYKYSKEHKLSAYPVVELYRRFSVTLVAPLSQQDVFVVPEAECSMHRSMRHNDSLDSSTAERSLSASYHSTRVKLSEAASAEVAPRRSISLIENVNTKVLRRLSLTPLSNSYTAKIILKHSLTPVTNNDVMKPVLVRTSTPLESKGHARGE